MFAFSKKKKETQPLLELSAGCIFKNHPNISAGELIEKAGLKGLRIGDAQVSKKHANFIINKGSATSKDVSLLIKKVRADVYKQFGVRLELELIIVDKNGRYINY